MWRHVMCAIVLVGLGACGGAGPAGPKGPMGEVGMAGATGPAGSPGSAGAAGPKGPQGMAGLSGASAFTDQFLASPATIPWDDTIPQSGEGVEVVTVTITPRKAGSRLLINAVVHGVEESNSADHLTAAVFRDAGADAVAVATAEMVYDQSFYGIVTTLRLLDVVPSLATQATTFRLRAGVDKGSININGSQGGRQLGGTLRSGLVVTEIP